uniref:Uncharacterized protein n=1 Tax=Arundo donax TaxID=35708 RepID=A0A0A9DD13_ARUDO
MDALHKTYMTHKEHHINIVPFKFDTPSPDDMVTTGLKSSRTSRKVDAEAVSKNIVNVTGKKMILLTEKDTSMDPSSSSKFDEFSRTTSNVPSNGQNKTLVMDHELQHSSLERKPKNSEPKITKPVSVNPRLQNQSLFHSTSPNDGYSTVKIKKCVDS